MRGGKTVVGSLLLLLLGGCGDRPVGGGEPPSIDLRLALGGDAAPGFARALAPAAIALPRDHGPHPAFLTEWWYWTGNVAAADGRAFGFELVFFRHALRPPGGPARAASLASDSLVLAHAALTDVDGAVFHAEERALRRDGVRADVRGGDEPMQLFAGDWSARTAVGGDGFAPVHLTARGREFAFAFDLRLAKPIVLQGDNGRSQKGRAPGNASFYYSATRMLAEGTVEVGGAELPVRGTAWCDREWGTSALDDEQVGWDWFSVQLDDDSEVMWYQLRRLDGRADQHSQGLIVHADGRRERLLVGEVRLQARGEWRARDGRAAYPAAWTLAIPRLQLLLEVTPRLPDQELRGTVRYWEGSVGVRGTRAGVALGGVGYLEMTGYAR